VGTSNIEHRTSNVEVKRMKRKRFLLRCSMFDVRRSTFDVRCSLVSACRFTGLGPVADGVDPCLEVVGLAGPLELGSVFEAGGEVVGVTAGEGEVPADVVFWPAGGGGEGDDVLGPPDGPG